MGMTFHFRHPLNDQASTPKSRWKQDSRGCGKPVFLPPASETARSEQRIGKLGSTRSSFRIQPTSFQVKDGQNIGKPSVSRFPDLELRLRVVCSRTFIQDNVSQMPDSESK